MTFGSSGTGTGTGMDNSIPEVLGSIYLLNIIVLRNVEEAETSPKIGLRRCARNTLLYSVILCNTL